MKSFIPLLLPLIFSGCSINQIPNYTPPLNEETALIGADFEPISNHRNGIDIYASHSYKCASGKIRKFNYGLLFSFGTTGSRPNGYREISAGKPIRINFHGVLTANQYCEINVEATLKPGNKYLLKGGLEQNIWPGETNPDLRGCLVSIINSDDGTILPLKKIADEYDCTSDL